MHFAQTFGSIRSSLWLPGAVRSNVTQAVWLCTRACAHPLALRVSNAVKIETLHQDCYRYRIMKRSSDKILSSSALIKKPKNQQK